MTPAHIVNRALDAIGRSDLAVGDIEEGSEGAQPALRAYVPALKQLLRAAHWSFARKLAPMVMLADATGQTAGVGTASVVPWIYEYAIPADMMQARFVPQNYLNPNAAPTGNIALPSTPQTTVSQPPYGYGMRLLPAPYVLSTDPNYPVDPNSNWAETEGSSPAGRVVILTNVNQASLVYTAYIPYPSMWDALFEQAMVDLLTTRFAMPLSTDKKFGLQVQNNADARLVSALTQARVASANESSFPQTTDNIPDWVRTRNQGGGGWGAWGPGGNGDSLGGIGGLYGSWSGLALGNGSVF